MGLMLSGFPLQAVTLGPYTINLSKTSLRENNVFGGLIGTLTTEFNGPSAPCTYSLVSGNGDADNGSFEVHVDDGGKAWLKIKIITNYEVKSSYTIRVKSAALGLVPIQKSFTILVEDVNEAPSNLRVSNTSVA